MKQFPFLRMDKPRPMNLPALGLWTEPEVLKRSFLQSFTDREHFRERCERLMTNFQTGNAVKDAHVPGEVTGPREVDLLA